MQILNQSQTALNLPNFTQCLKKFVFPSKKKAKKGVKTAQVRKRDGKSCRETLTEAKVAMGGTVAELWGGPVRVARLLVLGFWLRQGGIMNERSVAQIFDKSRECARLLMLSSHQDWRLGRSGRVGAGFGLAPGWQGTVIVLISRGREIPGSCG